MKIKCRLLQFLFGALRVNTGREHFYFCFKQIKVRRSSKKPFVKVKFLIPSFDCLCCEVLRQQKQKINCSYLLLRKITQSHIKLINKDSALANETYMLSMPKSGTTFMML